MKKLIQLTLSITLALLSLPAFGATAPKAGGTCSKAGVERTYKGKTYTCKKSGKKLLWSAGVAAKNEAAPVVSPTPSISPAPAGTLWAKYGLVKPTTVDVVIKSATDSFTGYTSQVRTNYTVKVVAQSDVDPQLTTWVQGGANFVAQRFKYPAPNRQFVDVLATDVAWLEETYAKEGYNANEVRDRVGGFNAGAPAYGGSNTNTWNYTTIKKNDLMNKNRTGMAQTAGHEYFHAIQEILAKGNNPGVKGENIPNWYWEGPAMFVGLQTAATLGYIDYKAAGRSEMTSRYQNGAAVNRTSLLVDIRENDGVKDPYAIGFAATEFLVSIVGMEKMVAVYEALGTTRDFAPAFKEGTGIDLADFLSMFEEVRTTLGFPKS